MKIFVCSRFKKMLACSVASIVSGLPAYAQAPETSNDPVQLSTQVLVSQPSQPQEVATNSSSASPYITESADNQWVINFNDTDISTVIQQIAKLTGENYVIASNVAGKVNVVSQTPLKKEDVSELLRSVLYANGLSITNSGNTMVIRSSDDAKKNKLPVDTSGKIKGEAFITRVIPTKYANPNDLLQAIQPLVSDFAVLKSLPDSSALLIADKADNVQKVAKLVAELDYPETDDVQTIKLTKSWVGNVMPLLEKLAPRELSASNNRAVSPIRVVGDEQNNSIMLKGDRNTRSSLSALISKLDQSSESADSIQVITLQNADAAKTADILKDMFVSSIPNSPPVSIKANPMTNALIVHAPPATVDEIRKTISQIDIPRMQVMIEAVIVEINDSLLDELGVQFGVGDASYTAGLLSTSLASVNGVSLASYLTRAGRANSGLISSGLTGAIGSSNNFSALIKALSSDTRANLLSTPSISTVANEEARILVGQNVPFLTGSYAQATTTTGTVNPFSTIQRQDIGVTLKVTPQINSGKRMTLKIEQEVSSISPTAVSGAADIITNKRTLNTTIMAENGQTVVLGGLISNDTTKTTDKIPLLGDIPVLGELLFQSNSEQSTKNNLLVFLRPTIIASAEDNEMVNLRRYNGIWELRLGESAQTNPLTTDKLNDEMEKNYNGHFTKPDSNSILPSHNSEPYVPPVVLDGPSKKISSQDLQ